MQTQSQVDQRREVIPSDASTSIDGTFGGMSSSKKRQIAYARPRTSSGHQNAIAEAQRRRSMEKKNRQSEPYRSKMQNAEIPRKGFVSDTKTKRKSGFLCAFYSVEVIRADDGVPGHLPTTPRQVGTGKQGASPPIHFR
ncbi:hypothetical protein ACLOJK_026499 [Asimina triloba]